MLRQHTIFGARWASLALLMGSGLALQLEAQSPIDAKYAQLGGRSGLLGDPDGPETANPDGIGRFRKYRSGVIYWSPPTGAHEVHGEILTKWTALRREQGFLGYPTSDERHASDGAGRFGDFQGGSIYWTAAAGPFEIHGLIREKWMALGNTRSVLGYPVTDETTTPDGIGRFNHFQNGSIYWTPSTGANEVHGAIRQRWADLGFELSFLGYPVSDEKVIPGFSGFGRFNRFANGSIYYSPDSGAVEVRDLAGALFTNKATPLQGAVNVLAILWDPMRPSPDQAVPASAIDDTLFGATNSVADWFRENTGGKVRLQRAGVMGWYAADKPASHYWNETPQNDPLDVDGDGFLTGHVEKWTEAIRKADPNFNFAAYDANGDGVLTGDELAIVIVIPQQTPAGFNRPPLAREYPNATPLVVDGVRIPMIVEWYAGAPNLGVAAHELSHLLINAPDEYQADPSGRRLPWAFAPRAYSIMDATYPTTHYDPCVKLKAGFVNYNLAVGSGEYVLKAVETEREVLILMDPARTNASQGPREYFILENRWRGSSYDAGRGSLGVGLPQDGLAVWRMIEDPALFPLIPAPSGAGEWGRRGIQLMRADGGATEDDSRALFNVPGMQLSDTTSPARLFWADGSPTGFTITVVSAAGPEMRIRIDRR